MLLLGVEKEALEGVRCQLSTSGLYQSNYFVVLVIFFTEEAKKRTALFCGKTFGVNFLRRFVSFVNIHQTEFESY